MSELSEPFARTHVRRQCTLSELAHFGTLVMAAGQLYAEDSSGRTCPCHAAARVTSPAYSFIEYQHLIWAQRPRAAANKMYIVR